MSINYEKEFAAFFGEMGDAAAAIALQYFRKNVIVDDKDDKTPVTQADREIEQKLRDLIKKKFPAHGVIGEEYGKDRADAEFVWVIDPIDGTKAFATGCPVFGTIIGLAHQGKPAVGLVEQAYTKERWFGVAGQFCRHNGQPAKVAKPRTLPAARLYSTSPDMFDDGYTQNFHTLRTSVKWARFGGDCYAYGLLALGWADLVVERLLKVHDVMGLVPLITGAGGYASDWDGNDITINYTSSTMCAASSRELALEAMQIMKKGKA